MEYLQAAKEKDGGITSVLKDLILCDLGYFYHGHLGEFRFAVTG